ncbi:gamma-glutamyl-gamma-aminobutyrate hydrolase family protein [Pseudoflavonifractor phocaeensis]|uniref:gamma-glutamyl-gamma-aminobutyrate hydrolase family protein n=1 Tax=Pseudoflavonifractor phocaeensis TaxID=1870988 RepID=UPI00313AC76D
MMPSILLSPSKGGCSNYENAVLAAGGRPLARYCPAETDWDCGGLLLCGGDDIDPARFGQENQGSTGIDPERDEAEFAAVRAFLAAGKPILAICRGHQILNVALGGSLRQDISPAQRLFHAHDPAEKKDRVHPLRAAEGSLLHRFYGPVFPVNSSHHQALDQLGEGLLPTAWSESELIEAVELPGRDVLGVQFHPERMTGALSRPDTIDGQAIFSWFLARCREAAHG